LARNARAALAAAALVLAAFALSGGMILGRATSDLLFYFCAAVQAAVAALGSRLAIREGASAFAVLVLGAALLRIVFVVQTPSLSGDVYRYIWDGRVIGAGFNPYLHVPADPALAALRDPEQYGLIDKRDYAVTIYPPVAEAIFALVVRISTRVFAMKLAMVLFEAAAVLAIVELLKRLNAAQGAVVAYLLHPAPIWEIAGNGHVDAAMMAFLYGAFVIGGASRRFVAAVPMTLGALVKPSGALGLPALWRPFQVGLPLFVLGLAVALYLPFAAAGIGIFGFLPRYLEEQGLTSGRGVFWLALFGKTGLPSSTMAPAFMAFTGVGLLALALWTRRHGTTDLASGLKGTALLLVAFLLAVTPTFPWYFLAALPMTPLLGLWSPYALATGGFLLYGFQADAPPFFGRWALLIGLAAAAAIRDLIQAARIGEV
jgi:hypothetical protein